MNTLKHKTRSLYPRALLEDIMFNKPSSQSFQCNINMSSGTRFWFFTLNDWQQKRIWDKTENSCLIYLPIYLQVHFDFLCLWFMEHHFCSFFLKNCNYNSYKDTHSSMKTFRRGENNISLIVCSLLIFDKFLNVYNSAWYSLDRINIIEGMLLTWPEGVKKLLTTVIICVSRMGYSFRLSSTPTNSFIVLRICGAKI